MPDVAKVQHKLIATTTKGLEKISLDELSDKISNFGLTAVADKKITFTTDTLPKSPKMFRTIDDLGLFVSEFTASNLDEILLNISKINFNTNINLIKTIRNLNPVFSVTITKFKPRINLENYYEELIAIISQQTNFKYNKTDHTNLDIRIFIEESKIIVSVKLFSKSLFFRDYRIHSQKGALKPSIAGAMLYYIENPVATKKRVVDILCGSGTFLCEAVLNDNEVYGCDISKESVKATINNLKFLYKSKRVNPTNLRNKIKVCDATKTNLSTNYFDIGLSNFPWDKQIKTDSITKLYDGAIHEYSRILKPDGKLALLGYKPDLMIKLIKKHFKSKQIETMQIGYLGQNPTIVFVT